MQEIHSTGCATAHLHGGCTTGSRSHDTTTIENVQADKNYPVTKRLVAYQQGAHVQCDVQRGSEMELEKRRGRATPERRSGESCWRAVRKSERRHLSTEKHHMPICTSVSFDKQNRASIHTQTPTSQNALPVVCVTTFLSRETTHYR